jgi:uncharacterized membrane protein YphA (DoxX/SURF4 family)
MKHIKHGIQTALLCAIILAALLMSGRTDEVWLAEHGMSLGAFQLILYGGGTIFIILAAAGIKLLDGESE